MVHSKKSYVFGKVGILSNGWAVMSSNSGCCTREPQRVVRIGVNRMKQLVCAAVLCLSACGVSVQALEGSLPADKTKELSTLTYSLNCAGGWNIRDIVKEINQWKQIKVGIDQRLVQNNKQYTDFKIEGLNPIAGCELLAKKLNCHLYVIRQFLYIGPELPPGMANPGGKDIAPPKPEPEKPKADPPAPPPPVAGNGGKPPTGNGNGPGNKPAQKPPPSQGAAKPPAEKPLGPLKPLTPGTGLADFPAVFPGVAAGSSNIVAFSHKSLKDCVGDGLPIVLLAYYTPADKKAMTPDETKIQARLDKDCRDAAGFFETLILEDPDVTAELKGKVSFILIPSTEPPENWPAAYTDPTKKEGAALFLIPKTGAAPILSWDSRNPQCCAAALIKAAKALLPAPTKVAVGPKVDAAQVAKKTDDANANPNGPNGPNDPKKVKPKGDNVKDE